MFPVKRFVVASAAVLAFTGFLSPLNSTAKPPKKSTSDSERISRPDLGFSYVKPDQFTEQKVEYKGISPDLVLQGPTTNQATTVVDSAHYTLNAYVGTAISLIQFPRVPGPDFDEMPATTAAKGLLEKLNSLFRSSSVGLNYQNSALIDISGHPALAVLAESSIEGLNDRRMVRFIVLNHRDKRDLFFFESNDTEFENKVPAFDAFLHSLKFIQPNVAPTPGPNKPINIQITN